MNSEALIKGRIAEHIIELLLEESGYTIIRIAQEGLLTNMARSNIIKLRKTNSAGKITTAPSFVVIDKSGVNLRLLKVKYWGEGKSGGNVAHGMRQIQQYWPEAMLVVLSRRQPFFRVIDGRGGEVPLETVFPGIKKETLLRFGRLTTKFFAK